MAKRAKTSTGDEPPASTSGAPVTTETGPEPSPRRSPRHTPQREFITLFPLASAGEVIFTANILGRAGTERQQGSPARDIPDVPSSSTAPPIQESSGGLQQDDVDTCKPHTRRTLLLLLLFSFFLLLFCLLELPPKPYFSCLPDRQSSLDRPHG